MDQTDASPSPQVQDLLEPLHDLLLVERDPDQEKIGRIYLADNSSLGKSQLGTVIKAGSRSQGYLHRRIVFSVGAGILLKQAGLLLLSPADILALIKVEKIESQGDSNRRIEFNSCPEYYTFQVWRRDGIPFDVAVCGICKVELWSRGDTYVDGHLHQLLTSHLHGYPVGCCSSQNTITPLSPLDTISVGPEETSNAR